MIKIFLNAIKKDTTHTVWLGIRLTHFEFWLKTLATWQIES